MLRKYLVCGVVMMGLMAASGSALAKSYGPQSKRVGAGLIAGEPTGLTFKGYLGPQLALDLDIAWSFVDDSVVLFTDVIYDFFEIPTSSTTLTFPFYSGVGLIIGYKARKQDSDMTVGIRVPIGINMHFSTYPLELFVEVAPGVKVAPKTDFDFSGGIGVRYYF